MSNRADRVIRFSEAISQVIHFSIELTLNKSEWVSSLVWLLRAKSNSPTANESILEGVGIAWDLRLSILEQELEAWLKS